MNDDMRKAINAKIDKVWEALDALYDFVNDRDEEKQRQSMLIWGIPDMHIKSPKSFERAVADGLADPNKPPFTSQGWMIYLRTQNDPRLTYAQIEEMKNSNPTAPWDDLRKEG